MLLIAAVELLIERIAFRSHGPVRRLISKRADHHLQLRIQVVSIMHDERLGRHRRLRRAPLRQPLVRDNHVLQPQQNLGIDVSPRRRFAHNVPAL